jgi:hypothetical protein
MSENKETTLTSVLAGLLLCIPAIVLWAMASRDAWNFFVQPVFTGLPTLTIATAIGLRLAVSTVSMNMNTKRNELDFGSQMFVSALGGLLSYWFVHLAHWILSGL